MRFARALALVVMLITAGRARAQSDASDDDAPTFGATGVAVRPIAAGSELDPTASATVLRMDARPRTVESLDETLLEAPGARVRRTGAFGGFTTLSLRGADAEQTQVLLGDIPIASADGSAFDLGSIPTWMLSRVEVYRGGAPMWLGAGAIGGVLRLVPRDDPGAHSSGSLSYGTFDLVQGRAAASAGDDRLHVTTAAGLTSFGGNFPYVDDNRTALDPRDDVTRNRQGADFVEGAAMLHLRTRVDQTRIEAAGLFTERTGGLSPPPTRYSDTVLSHRSTLRILGGASALYEDGDHVRLQLAAGLGVERRRVSDPLAQVGLVPREADDLLYRVTVRGAGTLRALDWLDLTMVATYGHESIAPSDVLASMPLAPSSRDSGAAGLEARAYGSTGDVRYELRPSARIEVLDAHLFELSPGALDTPHASTLAIPTGRLGAVIEPVRGVAIAASGYAAARPPSLIELFGDRAYLTGNAGLSAETSFGGDGGVVLAGPLGPFEGTVDLRGFASSVTNLIRYVRTDQFQYAPQNIAQATLAGAEASVVAAIPHYAQLNASFSYLYSSDDSPGLTHGNALPLRAPFSTYVRLSAGNGPLSFIDRVEVYGDLDYVAPSYADPSDLTVITGRMRFGAGITVTAFERHVAFEVIVRDVADARGVDVLGMPLAGRSVTASLSFRE